MEFPEDRKYTSEHEWVKEERDRATIGITAFAQEELGEIVFVELPKLGAEFTAGDSICVVESTKAASDVYAPVGGRVVEVNGALEAQPNLVNQEPYGRGWLVKLEEFSTEDLGRLLSISQYRTLVGQ